MNESNQIWGSPWRTLQRQLANQFGALYAAELCQLQSGDDGAADASSWIKLARQRQLRTHPLRQ